MEHANGMVDLCSRTNLKTLKRQISLAVSGEEPARTAYMLEHFTQSMEVGALHHIESMLNGETHAQAYG